MVLLLSQKKSYFLLYFGGWKIPITSVGQLSLEKLNTVETSVEIWLDFVDVCMSSDFYEVAIERTHDHEKSAALTLLRNYLGTFEEGERKRIEDSPELFYHYANGFINELSPYRYKKDGYDKDIREAFLSKIKTLLSQQKDKNGVIIHKDRYVFIRTIVKICSSLDYIIKIYDYYRKYMFREFAQLVKRPIG